MVKGWLLYTIVSAKGITGFVIKPDVPGVSAKPAYNMLGNHAKKFASHAAFEGLSTTMQAMGANGLLRENPLARQMSGARVTYYMDGTTEILNMVMGRSLQY